MLTTPAKSILSPRHEGGWFGSCYSVNLYRGCCHGCIYCDSRSECYGIRDFDTVRAKENALVILERELRTVRRRGVIMTGSMSDCYNPFEEQERLTRGALTLYERYGFGAAIDTKSPLAARDGDILRAIAKHSPVSVSFTVTCADDRLSSMIEQNVAPTSRRLEALADLSAQGIPCGILLMPVLPFITDSEENLLSVLRLAKKAGARWAFFFGGLGVTLRQNQRLHFLNKTEELFPGMKKKYLAAFGESYECSPPHARRLFSAVVRECEGLGLLWKMEDISASLLAPYDMESRQLKLF